MNDLQERIDRLAAEGKTIVLPDADLNLYRRRRGSREVLVSLSDLIALLYKAAADPQQDPTASDAFRFLAEAFEEVKP